MAAGTFSTRALLMLDLVMAAAGNGDSDVTMLRPLAIVEVAVLCTATDSGGNATMQLFRQALGAGGFNAVSSAISCFTLNAIGRTTQVVVAQRTLAATDVLRATIASAGGGTANGRMFIYVNPLPITGNA